MDPLLPLSLQTNNNLPDSERIALEDANNLLAGMGGMSAQNMIAQVMGLLDKVDTDITKEKNEIQHIESVMAKAIASEKNPALAGVLKLIETELSAFETKLQHTEDSIKPLQDAGAKLVGSNCTTTSDPFKAFIQNTTSTLEQVKDVQKEAADLLKSLMSSLALAMGNHNPATIPLPGQSSS